MNAPDLWDEHENARVLQHWTEVLRVCGAPAPAISPIAFSVLLQDVLLRRDREWAAFIAQQQEQHP